MVHLPHLGKLRREVKEEAVDTDGVPAGAAPFHKRSRLAQEQNQHQHHQWSRGGARASNQPTSQPDLIEEPSPLGLRLKKSPSLVDLIQMKLAQASKATDGRQGSNSGASEKLKASNFPGSVLRIGSWEWISRYEGDLVAKCYFAKHKLVWEVLDGGLKSKIEIQWSDICGIKMFCPENEAGTLEIALSRQPLFFRETNPQPRKHTLWQATSDFTGGQASLHRVHFLQCPPGLMTKHMEKLVHCDPRLYSLSQQNEINLENVYFESKCSIFEEPEDMKCLKSERMDDDQLGTQGPNTLLSPRYAVGSIDTEARQEARASVFLPGHFNNSVSATQMIKQDAASVQCEEPQTSGLNWDDGFRVPGGIKRSMSRSEIVSHIGQQMFKQMYPGSVLPSTTDASGKPTLDEFTRYLLSDCQTANNNGDGTRSFEDLTRQLLHDSQQITNGADEKMLMSRVNSLCCLIQRDSGASQGSGNPGDSGVKEMHEKRKQHDNNNGPPPVQEDGGSGSVPPPRQESFGDLLTNLPRISSFPHFL